MSDLIKIASSDGTANANVVFVHGLGAHPYWTWGDEDAAKANMESYWPLWVADEFSNIDVWVMSYAAPKTNWFGSALELEDRVRTVIARLRTTDDMLDKPIVFVCHSLGGLLVKSLLRKAAQNQSGDAGYQKLLENTKGVTFVATPHLGASMAKWADRLRFMCWPSLATIGLTKNSSYLRELNIWFENWRARPKVLVFYGTEDKIVEISSANPALPHVEPVPLEGSHSSVCIPRSKNSILPQTVFDFLEANLPLTKTAKGYAAEKPDALPPIERRKIPLLPFVVRTLVLMGLLGGLLWLILSSVSPTPKPSEDTPSGTPYERPTDTPLDIPEDDPARLPGGYRACGIVEFPPVGSNRAINDIKIKLRDEHSYIRNGDFGDTNYKIDNKSVGGRDIYIFRIWVKGGPAKAEALCKKLQQDGRPCTAKPGRC